MNHDDRKTFESIINLAPYFQDDLGQTVCKACRGDYYACDCNPTDGIERRLAYRGFTRILVSKTKNNHFVFSATKDGVEYCAQATW